MINATSWLSVFPEAYLLLMACAVLLLDLGVKSAGRTFTYGLTAFTLLGLVAAYGLMLGAQTTPDFLQANVGLMNRLGGFDGMVVSDALSNLLKMFAALAVLCALVYGRGYATGQGLLKRGGELFSLSLFALLGICVLIGAHNMLTLYLGLELLTLSSYALVALNRDEARSSEAAMKYFVLGALASGFLLFGISMVYGATGQLQLQKVFAAVVQGQANVTLLTLGLVFVVAGVAFKFSAAPFHLWAPDVYDGAPTVVTLLIASAPKLAAFALLLRLLVEGLGMTVEHWQQMLLVMAVLSLLVGNLAAIAQTNIKRMLAFSTIAQVGFIFLGLLSGFVGGSVQNAGVSYSGALFYVITYVLSSLVAFGVLLQLGREGQEIRQITDLAGLGKTRGVYAAMMALALFSFAGIPPLVGFFAKFAVLQPLVNSGLPLHLAVALFAVLMSLIGCFYYLRIVKVMYFDTPDSRSHTLAAFGSHGSWMLAINALALLVLGVFPDQLLILCAKAIHYTLGL